MLATLDITSRRTENRSCYVDNSPLNYTDPTGLTQAGNPLANLNLYGGGFSGNNVTQAKPVNPYIASANTDARIPAVNLAGGINSYSTPKAVDQYYVDQGLKNLGNPSQSSRPNAAVLPRANSLPATWTTDLRSAYQSS